ncbi:MAG TPA: sigma-70 family RNA polymerase sigma factor [Bacteroidia bacterium]|jgi:RNA polymerase sigma-70 factor (ECF subfamily)|nr:sigma-70 family RNA polymerase sigma factor [Bacteroidia bacterium]
MDELENSENRLTTKAVYDYRLVKLAIEKGDQKAFAELMHRYRESVYFMMLKMCNNKDDADDLTIEAFGRAFKKLEQYSPNYAFSTWLFKIASNNAIDFIRKKKQMNSVSIDNKSENSESREHSANIRTDTLDPEEHFIKKQKIELVRVLVDGLKPKYKEMIELFYFHEMSHEEISQKLDLPIGTIKAQLFRARDLLFSALKNRKEKY